MNPDTIQIGMRDGWGQLIPFGISLPDMRQHVYVVGKSGSGKSTCIVNMMIQLIERGHGVGFLDPLGDDCEKLLKQIPRWRTDHVVYFNPSDIEYPMAWNLLANVPKDERHLLASDIVGIIKGLWPGPAPRMEYILYNTIAALLECQNVSLLGVNQMLTDEKYRAWVIRQIKDPYIKKYWEHEFASYTEKFQQEAIAPIQNKVGQFMLNPVIRNILGQVKCKVNLPSIMDNREIFIANLSKGKIGHDKANLLGSFLVTRFQQAAMRRANQPEQERKDFFLFIDEFQNFTTESFMAILAEARKYRLCLVLSHQYVQQVPLPIQKAVFGNVGTMLSFRVGYDDGETMQKEFGNTFIAQQFVDLERYNVFAKILEHGTNIQPFKGVTHQPLNNKIPKAVGHLGQSRQRYAEPRHEVEAKLRQAVGRG